MARRLQRRQVDRAGAKAPALAVIEIVPAERLLFEPGHPHLLLRGLVTPLQWGRSDDMRVVFEKAGAVDVQISIGAH